MLLYAWNFPHILDPRYSEVEKAPTLEALFSTILAHHVKQRMRIGLGRDYRAEENEVYGIRGRVDFDESIRRMSFQHGRTFSRYQVFHENVPKNQIIRSALARLVQRGDFGESQYSGKELKNKSRKLVRVLDEIDIIELNPEMILREIKNLQDWDYRLMLTLCYIISRYLLPNDMKGMNFPANINRDELIIYGLYEKFVAAFFKMRLAGWKVEPQKQIEWHAMNSCEFLPVMKPDIVLQHHKTGSIIVLDTKFTKSILVKGRWDNETFDSNHIFQIYAYLKSQENCSKRHREATGILLYPAVDRKIFEKVEIQGHKFLWATIDLAKQWQEIDHDLLSIPKKVLEMI